MRCVWCVWCVWWAGACVCAVCGLCGLWAHVRLGGVCVFGGRVVVLCVWWAGGRCVCWVVVLACVRAWWVGGRMGVWRVCGWVVVCGVCVCVSLCGLCGGVGWDWGVCVVDACVGWVMLCFRGVFGAGCVVSGVWGVWPYHHATSSHHQTSATPSRQTTPPNASPPHPPTQPTQPAHPPIWRLLYWVCGAGLGWLRGGAPATPFQAMSLASTFFLPFFMKNTTFVRIAGQV